MEKTPKDYLVNNNAEAGGSGSGNKRKKSAKEQMPIPCISSLMKTVLPPNAKISEGAIEAVQSCLAEYIGLITSEANKRSRCEMRKTIHPEDIIYALSKRGFNDYVAPLTSYLCRYRQHEAAQNAERGEPSVRRTYPPYNDSHPLQSISPARPSVYSPTELKSIPSARPSVYSPTALQTIPPACSLVYPPTPLQTIQPAPPLVYLHAPQAVFLPLVPPAPAMYYGGAHPSTHFAPLHQSPMNGHYRFPVQASAIDHHRGLTFNHVVNAFPGVNSVVTGIPMNVTGMLDSQVSSLYYGQFIPVNAMGMIDAQAFHQHRGQFIPVNSMGVLDAQVSVPQSEQINPSNNGDHSEQQH